MILRWNLVGVLLIVFVTLGSAKKGLIKQDNSTCPVLTECPYNPQVCQDELDCNPDSVCCKSPCGQVCTKQLTTGCRTLRTAASRRAKALGVDTKQVRMPRCSQTTGSFEPIQCSNEIVSSCWCVDEAGFELPGTRAPAAALVNCTAPKSCAAHTCRMFCPHGFSLARDGCPLCKCRDPCEDIKCPDSLACQLEELACADPPCPPIPTCKRGRSLDNICPVGDPLRISDTVRPFLCGNDPTKPNCPPMYQCLVQKGNDYGVCCPASLQIKKTGSCPAMQQEVYECGIMCTHDLECSSVQKCCNTEQCGSSCVHPVNVTECIHQRALSEVLAVSERAGRGYVPQCGEDGQFEPKQCSRNNLVCWCVDRIGRKLKGSMGHVDNVKCSLTEARSATLARSININGKSCERVDCAAVCEYGFKLDNHGCPTCKCDDPCDGYQCPEDEECVTVREASCVDFLCPTLPVCRPKELYTNPCITGTPLTDDLSGAPITCTLRSEESGNICPARHDCTAVAGSTQAVCCPVTTILEKIDGDVAETENMDNIRPQTMCEYLHSFSSHMEGTREGMALALPPPTCDLSGNFHSRQCSTSHCWCADHFGTEIPHTRAISQGSTNTRGSSLSTSQGSANTQSSANSEDSNSEDSNSQDSNTQDNIQHSLNYLLDEVMVNGTNCTALWETLDCLDLTCRLGCDYGFVLDAASGGCPTCQCRDPCVGVTCQAGEQCQLVEVSCVDQYCPPVPACLPKKIGQCPYLVPTSSTSCDFECNTDLTCNGTARCCSNGCGTQCVEPLLQTACQHQRTIAEHHSHEAGIPPNQYYIPSCTPGGSYERRQCDPMTRQCYCVDRHGFELSQTRVAMTSVMDCDNPDVTNDKRNACPTYRCPSSSSSPCEHGFHLDAQGCRTCQCRDPCARVNCRADGELCRVVNVECVDTTDDDEITESDEDSCPGVAMCLPHRDNPCGGSGEAMTRGGEQVTCGPDLEACPSSHKCQLSPLGEYAVCCPKPRDVCFEAVDNGKCSKEEYARNLTRYSFNSRTNKCEAFPFTGCQGNHNNFHSEEMCNMVCPVLSQCERLREKNQRAAERYHKATFMPQCEGATGTWLPVQCLDHVGVCWCVTPQGEPLKGTLTRGAQPDCNFRQARRNRVRMGDGGVTGDADLVLEELMMQLGSLEEDDEELTEDNFDQASADNNNNNVQWEFPLRSRCESLSAQCDTEGRFLSAQCDDTLCWCVDEAGNQLPNTSAFEKGTQLCLPTPIESVEVTLGFRGEYDDITAVPVVNQVNKVIRSMKGVINEDGITPEITSDVLYVRLQLIGSNKVDVAYRLEQMVMQQRLAGVIADITRSRFTHRLGLNEPTSAERRVVSIEHREIVSQSPVSMVAHYHTALIVIAATSAFIISVLTLLVILYRRKMASLNNQTEKIVEDNQRFLSLNRPIYIELPNEKQTITRPDIKPVQ